MARNATKSGAKAKNRATRTTTTTRKARGKTARVTKSRATKTARKTADRNVAWKANYLLGRVYAHELQYHRELSRYRDRSLTIEALRRDLAAESYPTALSHQADIW